MSHKPRTYAEISAERRARVLAGESLIAKGRCFMCDWKVPPGALWCAKSCCDDYQTEKAELTATR